MVKQAHLMKVECKSHVIWLLPKTMIHKRFSHVTYLWARKVFSRESFNLLSPAEVLMRHVNNMSIKLIDHQ
jgi:hypothetical protein